MFSNKFIPERVCIICKKMCHRNLLHKITLRKEHKSNNADILLDEEYKTPGRSVYICKESECFEKVHKQRKKISSKLLKFNTYKNFENKVWQIIEEIECKRNQDE